MKYDLLFENDDPCSKTNVRGHRITIDAVDDDDAIKKARDSIKELARGFEVSYFELFHNGRVVEFLL